jgi:condensin complex subunit 3
VYVTLHDSLISRLSDKEPPVRSYAVLAISKLIAAEDPTEGQQSLTQFLLDALSFDPSPEVRRSALLCVPLSSANLPCILSRTRDVDPVIRKLLLSTVLPRLDSPRQLTLSQREQVIADALGDREPGVRVAGGKLISEWFEFVSSQTRCVTDGLVGFLELLDVIGGETVAVDALKSLFVTREDLLESVTFNGWDLLFLSFSILIFVRDRCVLEVVDSRVCFPYPCFSSVLSLYTA